MFRQRVPATARVLMKNPGGSSAQPAAALYDTVLEDFSYRFRCWTGSFFARASRIFNNSSFLPNSENLNISLFQIPGILILCFFYKR